MQLLYSMIRLATKKLDGNRTDIYLMERVFIHDEIRSKSVCHGYLNESGIAKGKSSDVVRAESIMPTISSTILG